ncbi:MAG TPA: M28 family peptidase [Gemmatimonadaceae bacterium]|nr:M28 family peptidase [Gemmatimonadaceae bacterium]
MSTSRFFAALVLAAASLPASAQAQRRPALNEYGNPARLAPAPTTSAITPRDLQIRLYQFADDSMQGRQVGRAGNAKGTAYIAAELKRLGLVPAGDNGSFFQVLPYHLRKFTDHSRLTVSGNPLQWEVDWVAVPGTRAPRPIAGVEVVFGGVAGDTTRQISAEQAAGKFVVVLPAPSSAAARGGPPARFAPPPPSRLGSAVAVATVDLDVLTPAQRRAINEPAVATQLAAGRGRPGAPAAATDSLTLLKQQLDQLAPQAALRLTKSAAARLFGTQSVEALPLGTRGGSVTASLDFVELPSDYARNVVAILPGSDPALAGQYVAIGAHNDHVGFNTPVDKDSLKAFNNERNKRLLANKMVALNAEQLAAIRVDMDSVRRVHPVARLDSINNGADDDGSGSMAVLEIAEFLQAQKVKPKRSTLFVWHTGEEAGLIGSAFFTRNPTVPMDSIVAQLNIDMIGRGREGDLPGGSPDYLGVVGSFFDSKDLGETVAAVNTKQAKALTLDYKYDSTLSWTGYNNIYGRSDHYNYAVQGVPIAFFFTGLHGDYHQRTDEPEFIDYPHYARITNYIRDLTVEVANGPRPRINGTRPAKPPRPTVP